MGIGYISRQQVFNQLIGTKKTKEKTKIAIQYRTPERINAKSSNFL
jgi:hypothetical protein